MGTLRWMNPAVGRSIVPSEWYQIWIVPRRRRNFSVVSGRNDVGVEQRSVRIRDLHVLLRTTSFQSRGWETLVDLGRAAPFGGSMEFS